MHLLSQDPAKAQRFRKRKGGAGSASARASFWGCPAGQLEALLEPHKACRSSGESHDFLHFVFTGQPDLGAIHFSTHQKVHPCQQARDATSARQCSCKSIQYAAFCQLRRPSSLSCWQARALGSSSSLDVCCFIEQVCPLSRSPTCLCDDMLVSSSARPAQSSSPPRLRLLRRRYRQSSALWAVEIRTSNDAQICKKFQQQAHDYGPLSWATSG